MRSDYIREYYRQRYKNPNIQKRILEQCKKYRNDSKAKAKKREYQRNYVKEYNKRPDVIARNKSPEKIEKLRQYKEKYYRKHKDEMFPSKLHSPSFIMRKILADIRSEEKAKYKKELEKKHKLVKFMTKQLLEFLKADKKEWRKKYIERYYSDPKVIARMRKKDKKKMSDPFYRKKVLDYRKKWRLNAYKNDPEYRAKALAAAKKYREENRELIRTKAAKCREKNKELLRIKAAK